MIDDKTIVYDEEVKGWTSFFSYEPELMTGLNGRFFSFSEGELYLHNSKNVPRNNFYGEQYSSKVSVIFNDDPSTEKMFKNIMLEGNKTWSVNLKTNLTEGSIFRDEFHKKKSRYFAYTRRNEDNKELSSFAANGIGVAESVVGNVLGFKSDINNSINIGDNVTQIQGEEPIEIGFIESIDRKNKSLSFGVYENPPSGSGFCYATKNARIEGDKIRGYYMRADLENIDIDFSELFAITSNTANSYV